MPYLYVKDFRLGLDARRMVESTPAGALIKLQNGHITRGAEIEKRKAFVKTGDLPTNTYGLYSYRGDIYVFGSEAPGNIAPLPNGVQYVQLVTPGATDIVDVLDIDVFDEKLYVTAEFTDDIWHFYDGTVVNPAVVQPKGTFSMVHNSKVYTTEQDILRFSAVGDPTAWNPATDTGSGFISMSSQTRGSTDLLALAEYYQNVAVFGQREVLVWFMAEDPAQNSLIQVLQNTGTFYPHTVTQFGDSDVFYVDLSGVRSLRARDSSNAAFVSDVGTPVDTLIQDHLATANLNPSKLFGLMEPVDGRFWFSCGCEIFVFTFFSGADVKAWSTYTIDFQVDFVAVDAPRVYLRSRDALYLYGGLDNTTYDGSVLTVQLPYLHNDQPATRKIVKGFDMACEGEFDVSVHNDPQNLDFGDTVATIGKTTYDLESVPMSQWGTHISMKMVSRNVGYSRISNAVIHMENADAQ